MKKILTAMGNPKLNEKLQEEKEFQIIGEDIQYQEGILEFLEQNDDIDYLILNELLVGNIELKELIEKIKQINSNIQIILFLENKKEELENYLYAKGIQFIFYNNQIEISEIIHIIKNNEKNKEQEIKKEINELKKIVLQKEEEKKNKKISFLPIIKKKEKIQKKEIICVTGTSGIGKSIFTINLAKSLMLKKEKILIIDFDILNNSLHTILGIKKYSDKIRNKIKNNNLLKEIQIEELIIKVNSKIDLISGINLLFDSKYKISSIKIKNILEKLKEKYPIIIIDTSSECFFDYTKELIKNSNINIFITEANLLEIKKAQKLLNIYKNEWNIEPSHIHILFNKYNENSIDISILKQIFSEFPILGKLSVSSQYNLLINKNNQIPLNKNLQQEYRKINNEFLEEKSLIKKQHEFFKNIYEIIKKLKLNSIKNK